MACASAARIAADAKVASRRISLSPSPTRVALALIADVAPADLEPDADRLAVAEIDDEAGYEVASLYSTVRLMLSAWILISAAELLPLSV